MNIFSKVAAYVRGLASVVWAYVVLPVDGAVRARIRPQELLDAILAGLAAGGLANVLPHLAGHVELWTIGLSPQEAALVVGAIRLVQRFLQGAPPASAKLAAKDDDPNTCLW